MTDGDARGRHAANGARSPLLRDDWRHIEAAALEDFTAHDLALLDAQFAAYTRERRAGEVLRMLGASENDPAYGYRINNYRHCLQSASLALRAGKDEEYVVVALVHDIACTIAPEAHGDIAAALVAPFIMPESHWLLVHHELFRDAHAHNHPAHDPDAREQWRGHPVFVRAVEFAALFDQDAMDPDYDSLALEVFEPMVRRLFERSPRPTEAAEEL